MSAEDFKRQFADLQDEINNVRDGIRSVQQKIAHCEEITLARSRGQPISDEIYGYLASLSNAELKAERSALREKEAKLMDEKAKLMEKEAKLMDEKAKLMEKENQPKEVTKQLYEKDNRTKEKLESKGKKNTLKSYKDASLNAMAYMKEMLEAKIQEEKYLIFSNMYSEQNVLCPLANFDSRTNKLAVRDCYTALAPEILKNLSGGNVDYIYVTGTPGVGKTTFRNYMVWYLLRKFKNESRALRIIMAKGGEKYVDLLCLEANGDYYVEDWKSPKLLKHFQQTEEFVLGQNLFCLADVSKGDTQYTGRFLRGLIYFTSPNRKAWSQEQKQNAVKYYMPLWTWDEVNKFSHDIPDGVDIKGRFHKYGGVVRLIWGSDATIRNHERELYGAPTFETFVASSNDVTIDPSGVQHRYIYLDTCRDAEGKLHYEGKPVYGIGSRYIADILSQKYAEIYFNLTTLSLSTLMPPAMHGMLFEKMCFHLLARISKRCAFFAKPLKSPPRCSKTSSKSAESSSTSRLYPGFLDQLIGNLASDGFWYFRPPSKIEIVEFNGEQDVLKTVDREIEKHRAILAVPRSMNFAGFDGILAWKGALEEKDLVISTKVGASGLSSTSATTSADAASTSSSSSSSSSIKQGLRSPSHAPAKKQTAALDSTKYALLMQCTIRGSHPLVPTGAMILKKFVDAGFRVAIVYIIHPMRCGAFKRQSLRGGEEYKEVFGQTPQWCLYMKVRAAQSAHRETMRKKGSKRQKLG